MSSIAQFELLLRQLLSPDNTLRNQAEQSFNECKKYPDNTVVHLLQLLRGSADTEVRSLSIILLRRMLLKESEPIWAHLSRETQQGLKQGLLAALVEEKVDKVKHKLSVCISALAASLVNSEGWPELLPALFNFAKTDQPALREAALHVFAQLAQFLGASLVPYFSLLRTVLVLDSVIKQA